MLRSIRPVLTGALILSVAACSDFFGNANAVNEDPTLAVAFQSVPMGYSTAQNSYGEESEGTGPFFPGAEDGGMGPGRGRGRGHEHDIGRGLGPLIGFGIKADFLGGRGLGWLFGRGRHGDPDVNGSLADCTFNAASGRVECDPVTGRRGLTIERSVAFTDTAGAVQQAFDTLTTDRINTRTAISGSLTRRDSAVTEVEHSSDRTIAGIAKSSTQHRIDGVAAGRESTTGTDSSGAFSVLRVAFDTIAGVIIPKADTGRTYPTAGTIVRRMQVTRTRGGETRTLSRREVITYDGSTTAKLVVTQGDSTRTCSIPLPFGRPTCQ